MSVYYNKKLISGVREVPKMTLAEYNALTNKPDVWVRTDAPDSDRGITASDVEYSTGVSVKDKIDDMDSKKVYHKGDTVYLYASNLMLVGRTGWAGKEFYFSIPLDKPIGSDISSASISFGSGGSIYLISYNQAIDITNTSKTNSISGIATNNTMLSLRMTFTNKPLSITDGIVNLMLNKATTITFS